jgi:threonine dehydrogenase-like Zn-dependent dehydrogenase
LASGKIRTDALVTHVFKIDDFFWGIKAITGREGLKVVIKPNP